MKVLVFTTVFPNPAQPTHGLFVFERIRHLTPFTDIRIVAPVCWPVRLRQRVAHVEMRDSIAVLHPTFWYLPGVFKVIDGLFLFCSSVIAVARLRRGFRFDLIDAHFSFPDGFAAVLLGLVFRCPVTITVRGTLGQLLKYRLRRIAAMLALRGATRVLAVSSPLADQAMSLGVDRARLEVIPNGVDAGRFAPLDRLEARARLAIPVEQRLIVSVGHLSRRKGFHRVIAVLPRLFDAYPTVSLAVVGGPGVERDNARDLQRQVRAPQVAARVVLAGAQPPDIVRIWLSAADLFVLASDFEGCPNVIWEALACGLPVVATRVGDIPRMVPPFAGLLFDDPDDAASLERCLRSALDRTWDRDAIRTHAAQHSWQSVAQRVLWNWRQAVSDEATEIALAH
jgi:glycosyltransferase involved in cell wall biosynthesis